MYSQGEMFYYTLEDEEKIKLTVLENLILDEKEYLITEDFDGNNYIFLYDEDEENIVLLEDVLEINSIIDFWKEEYLGCEDIGDWEESEYYDREDSYDRDDYYNDLDDDSYYDDKDFY